MMQRTLKNMSFCSNCICANENSSRMIDIAIIANCIWHLAMHVGSIQRILPKTNGTFKIIHIFDELESSTCAGYKSYQLLFSERLNILPIVFER